MVHQLISVLKPGLVIADKLQTATDYRSHKTIIHIFIKTDLTFTDLGHDVGCLYSQIEIIIWILLVKVVVDIRLVRDPPGARSRPQKSGFSAGKTDSFRYNYYFLQEKQTLLDTIIIFCRKTDSFRYNYYFLQKKQTLLDTIIIFCRKTDSFRYNYYFLQEKQTLLDTIIIFCRKNRLF